MDEEDFVKQKMEEVKAKAANKLVKKSQHVGINRHLTIRERKDEKSKRLEE